MDNRFTKENLVSGFMWSVLQQFGGQAVSLVVSILLARLLLPEDYGLVATVSIFTTVANVFVKSGLGTALVQKKDADDIDFSTAFYSSITFSVLIYIVMFFAAPCVAEFFEQPQLTAVLRVLSLTLVLSGIGNVQQACISRNLDFKMFFFSSLLGTIISAVVGIVMAYIGYGVWAIVAQQLISQVINTAILFFKIDWKPSLKFSFSRLKRIYSFGWKLFVSELITSVCTHLQEFIIGKRYSSADLALYNKGNQIPSIISRNLDNSIQSVVFPVLSNSQDDMPRFRYLMKLSCSVSFYFICPMMVGMIVVAEPMIRLLLTDKWIECVPYVQLYCFIYLLRPIEATNVKAIFALGRSDIMLVIDIIKRAYGILLLIVAVGVFNSPLAICVALVIETIINTIIEAIIAAKLTKYTVWQQIKSLFGIILASVLMGAICEGMKILLNEVGLLLQFFAVTLCGIISYLVFSILLELSAFNFVWNYLKEFKNNRKNNRKEI